jgi:hypothetical protein
MMHDGANAARLNLSLSNFSSRLTAAIINVGAEHRLTTGSNNLHR